jgi:hypothetical protein
MRPVVTNDPEAPRYGPPSVHWLILIPHAWSLTQSVLKHYVQGFLNENVSSKVDSSSIFAVKVRVSDEPSRP